MAIKCLSIGLSLLMYLSTCGITVHQHFCKDELKSIAFWTKAKTCHKAQKVCPHHPPSPTKKDCCDNEVAYHQSDWTGPSADITLFLPLIFPQAEIPRMDFNKVLSDKDQGIQLERPPPEGVSRIVLYQSFLC